MGKYSDYRIGSPVVVKGRVTVISELPDEKRSPFGFKVAESADAHSADELEPIKLTGDILNHFLFHYDHRTELWEYEAKGHIVKFDESGVCLVDDNRKEDITYLHELKNLLNEECDGFVLRKFTRLPQKDE